MLLCLFSSFFFHFSNPYAQFSLFLFATHIHLLIYTFALFIYINRIQCILQRRKIIRKSMFQLHDQIIGDREMDISMGNTHVG